MYANYNFELWKRLDREVTGAGFSQETYAGMNYSKWHPAQRYAKGRFYLAIDMEGINYDASVMLWNFDGRNVCSTMIRSNRFLPRGLDKKISSLNRFLIPLDRFLYVISMPEEKMAMAAENCLNEKALEEL